MRSLLEPDPSIPFEVGPHRRDAPAPVVERALERGVLSDETSRSVIEDVVGRSFEPLVRRRRDAGATLACGRSDAAA